jgi:hypothetical protein
MFEIIAVFYIAAVFITDFPTETGEFLPALTADIVGFEFGLLPLPAVGRAARELRPRPGMGPPLRPTQVFAGPAARPRNLNDQPQKFGPQK